MYIKKLEQSLIKSMNHKLKKNLIYNMLIIQNMNSCKLNKKANNWDKYKY